MIITLSPMRRDDQLTASVAGTILTLNGQTVDPATCDPTTPCQWIVGQPVQAGGEWHVTLLLPAGPLPDGVQPDDPAVMAVRFPEPVTVTEDGPVTLPAMPAPAIPDAQTGA